jgi:hypothetical protein
VDLRASISVTVSISSPAGRAAQRVSDNPFVVLRICANATGTEPVSGAVSWLVMDQFSIDH